MSSRRPQVAWERQGWVFSGPEVPFDGRIDRLRWPAPNGLVARDEPDSMAPSTSVESGTVRIGDAERDQAISSLGDHFAAGRLTREEFDERSDTAMRARIGADLEPLFVDLPQPAVAFAHRSGPGRQPGPFRRGVNPMLLPLFWLLPMLLVGAVVGAMVLSSPWILWVFLWVFMFSGFWGRRHLRHR